MPRMPRGQQAGFAYRLINRGNGRATNQKVRLNRSSLKAVLQAGYKP